jgi:hypothetical protein
LAVDHEYSQKKYWMAILNYYCSKIKFDCPYYRLEADQKFNSFCIVGLIKGVTLLLFI